MSTRALLTLTFALAPLVAQSLHVEPAQLLPGDQTLGPAVADQRAPVMATGGGTTLLVWDDLRGGDRDVFATRLDQNGAPLDPVPLAIARGSGDQTAPQVAWNGTHFLVAWLSQELAGGYYRNEPRAARVSPQGVIVDAAPIVLPIEADLLALASDGADWLLATTGTTAGNSGIRGWRIAGSGALSTPAGPTLVPATYFVYFGMGLAWANGTWLVIWSQNDDVVGRRFDTNLQPLDAAPVALRATPRIEAQPHLASNGTQFVITTWDQDTYWSQGVSCVRFTSALAPLDATPIAVGTLAAYLPGARAAWDGSQWVVAWLAYPSTRVARLAANGTVLDPGGQLVEPTATASIYTPAIAGRNGGGAQVVWQDLRNNTTADLLGATLTGTGSLGVVQPVALGTSDQQAPAIAGGDRGHLVVFRTGHSAGSVIGAQRLDAFGAPLDAQPIVVGPATSTSRPAVAFDGTRWLICWNQSTTVVGRRMATDGTFVDAAPFVVLPGVSTVFGAPDVAANGGVFLVTAVRPATYPQFQDPWGRRVRGSDGLLLDTGPLLLGSSFAVRPQVTALGTGFVVVYEQHWSHNQTSSTIARTLVDQNGLVGASGGVAIATSSAWGAVDVASDGTTALITWASGSNHVAEDVLAQRMDQNGNLLGTPQNLTAAAASGQSHPVVSHDGEHFVVAFETLQNNLFFDRAPDVGVVRVRPDGTLVDASPHLLFSGLGQDLAPAIGALVEGHLLVAVHRFVADGAHASNRVSLRVWGPTGLSRFGAGTPGCDGAVRCHGNSAPRVGNAGFALVGDRLAAQLQTFVLFGTGADLAGSDPFGLGVLLHVQPAGLVVLATTADGSGVAIQPLPIPPVPSLAGSALHAQMATFYTACLPSPLGLGTSNGVTLTIRP